MWQFWLIAFGYFAGVEGFNERDLVQVLTRLGQAAKDKRGTELPFTILTDARVYTTLDEDQLQQAASIACSQLRDDHSQTIRSGCQVFEQVASKYLVSLGKKVHNDGVEAIGRLARFNVYYRDKKRYWYRSVKEIVPLVCEKATKEQFQSTVSAVDHCYVSKACSYIENLTIEFMAGFYSEADFKTDVYPWHLQQRNGVHMEDSDVRVTYDQVKGMIASFCAGQLPRSNEQSEITSRMCTFFEVQVFKILQLIQGVLKQTSDEMEQYGLIEESGKELPFSFRHARMTIVKLCAKPYTRNQLAYAQSCDYLLNDHIELMLGPVFQ